MKIALAQINTTVGDLAGNRDLILAAYREAVAGGHAAISVACSRVHSSRSAATPKSRSGCWCGRSKY